jgi:polycomb group RING finger protein 3
LINYFICLVCKKCIVEYLEDSNHCPRCDIELHHSYPLQQIAHDRTLQSIVYKIVANLEKNEIQRQIDFYKEKNMEFPAQLKEKIEQSNLFNDLTSNKADQTESSQPKENGSNDYHRSEEPMSLILEPLEGLEVC